MAAQASPTLPDRERDILRDAPVGSAIWIVVPAYNEAPRIRGTLAGLLEKYSNIVVVDDGSRDDTAAIALEFENVWVLRHAVNCGQGASLQTGIDFALERGAQVIVTFDADGQHGADDLGRMVAPVLAGECDVALGSRFRGQVVDMPWSRWAVLKLGILFTRVFSRIDVTDTHNGLRALSRHAAKTIRISLNRMAHASEILDQIRLYKLKFREVPVTIRYTAGTLAKGQSSWNSVRIVGQLIMSRFVR